MYQTTLNSLTYFDGFNGCRLSSELWCVNIFKHNAFDPEIPIYESKDIVHTITTDTYEKYITKKKYIDIFEIKSLLLYSLK